MDFQEQMRLQGWTSITRLEFGPFLALLEQDGQTKKVDELLQKEPRFFDEVLLGESWSMLPAQGMTGSALNICG